MFYKPYHIYIDLLRRKHDPAKLTHYSPAVQVQGTRLCHQCLSPGLEGQKLSWDSNAPPLCSHLITEYQQISTEREKINCILRNRLLPDTLSPAALTLPLVPDVGKVRHHSP